MKFQITFKDPNALNIHQVANDILFDGKDEDWLEAFGNLSSVQRKEILDGVKETVFDFLSKWMKSNEYVTIEFNIDTQTAMVVPCLRS